MCVTNDEVEGTWLHLHQPHIITLSSKFPRAMFFFFFFCFVFVSAEEVRPRNQKKKGANGERKKERAAKKSKTGLEKLTVFARSETTD